VSAPPLLPPPLPLDEHDPETHRPTVRVPRTSPRLVSTSDLREAASWPEGWLDADGRHVTLDEAERTGDCGRAPYRRAGAASEVRGR